MSEHTRILKLYAVSVAAIWGVLEAYSYFGNDALRNFFGPYWWGLYVAPLPFITIAILLKRKPTPVRRWEALINNKLTDTKVYGEVDQLPRIEVTGDFDLTKEEARQTEVLRRRLQENDLHAMTSVEPILVHSPVVMRAKTIDYAGLTVLRKQNRHGYILSASAVIVCRDRRVLVVHHRSSQSATYGDHFHTIGGAYNPMKEGNSLLRTAQREAYEEVEAGILIDEKTPMVIVLEKPTRFLQLVFLGATISARQCDNLVANLEEGDTVKIPFDELRKWLTESHVIETASGGRRSIAWVPSGKAHILAWLAYGAPGTGWSERFGGVPATKLFRELVS